MGLVFEKLNGYKEGSFFTPSFITSYMCAQSIRKVVLEKFQSHGYKAQNLTALRNEIDINRLNEANKIFLSIHICDPAVGSGHFLVSALNELIAIKHELGLLLDCDGKRLRDIDLALENDELIIKDSSGKIIDYTIPAHERIESHIIQKAIFYTKREIIEHCLFGVDINPSSVEICKLRLWIELLKYSYYENIATREIQTLPNIDINIKCGNSLISNFTLDSQFTKTQTKEFIQNLKITISDYKAQVALYKEALTNKRAITDKIHALKTLLQNYLIQNSSESKRLIELLRQFVVEYGESYFDIDTTFGLEMLRIIRQKGREKVAFRFQPTMEQLEPKDLDKNGEYLLEKIKAEFDALESLRNGKSFEWRFEFPEVLDENGDFMGFDLVIGNPPYIKEADNKRLFEKTKDLRTYQGKMDIWYHFVGKGLDLVKNKHIVTFIATNNWTTNTGAQNLRNMILHESQILNLVDFGAYMCFDSASIQTMIMEFQKCDSIPKSYAITYAKIEAKKPTDSHRDAVLARQIFEDNIYLTPIITPKNLIDKTLNFVDTDKDLVLNKILKNGKFRLQKNEVWQGLVHPQPTLDRKMVEILKELGKIHSVGEGVFNLTIDEINKLSLSKSEQKLLKPYYEANHLPKYYGIKATNIYVIYTDSSFKNPKSMDKYPNLKRHLDNFQSIITSDNKPYGLHRARKQGIFEGVKILSRVKCVDYPIFTYVDFDCYVGLNFNIIQTNRIDMKYLTGILNSKLIAFWLRYKGKLQGTHYQINQEPLLKIPIVKPNAKNRKIADKIINLVDKILESKSQGKDTTPLESQIDDLVYKLYNLNDSEIKIIEKT